MKFSDKKFVQKAMTKEPQTKLADMDLSAIRGLGSSTQDLLAQLGYEEPKYEPVWFAHPQQGHKVMGWLTAVDSDGNARVEIGSGQYAIVPPSEIRRVGEKVDKEKLRQQIKFALGGVGSFSADGVRADLRQSSDSLELEDGSFVINLRYAETSGIPDSREVSQFVEKYYKGASLLDIDSSMPGRVSVQLVAEDKQALDSGDITDGEVQEVLDPEEDVKSPKEAQLSSFFNVPKIAPEEIAKSLVNEGNQRFISQALDVYFKNGGTGAIAKTKGSVTAADIVAAAMPVVQRAKPSLYKAIAQHVSQLGAGKAVQPMNQQPKVPNTQNPNQAQPAQPAQSQEVPESEMNLEFEDEDNTPNLEFEPDDQPFGEGQLMNNDTERNFFNQNQVEQEQAAQSMKPGTTTPAGQDQEVDNIVNLLNQSDVSSASPEQKKEMAKRILQQTQKAGQVKSAARRTALFEPKDANKIMSAKDELNVPGANEVFAAMNISKMARRGDYNVATVEFDPKLYEGSGDPENSAKAHIRSFVRMACGNERQGSDFGIIGKVYINEIDMKKGTARVQFASEHRGPAVTEVTND